VELTLADAKSFLASLGITSIPDVFLQLLVNQINSVDECLALHGYSANNIALMKYYALALLGIMQPGRQITQQRAPSGASQSYAFGTLEEGYKKYSVLLRGLDLEDCLGAILPADPFALTCGMIVGRAVRDE